MARMDPEDMMYNLNRSQAIYINKPFSSFIVATFRGQALGGIMETPFLSREVGVFMSKQP